MISISYLFELSMVEKQRKYFDEAVKKFHHHNLKYKEGRKFTYPNSKKLSFSKEFKQAFARDVS